MASRGVQASHIGYLLDDPQRLRRVWDALTGFVAQHGLRPVIGTVLPFADVAAAHRLMESRRSVGKILLEL